MRERRHRGSGTSGTGTVPWCGPLRPDGGYVEVPVADWPSVVDHLRRFGAPGSVDVAEDRVAVSVGSSSITVTREGRVETGMPLHGFQREDVEILEFDHGAGHLRIRDDDGLVYEFRRP